MLFVLTCGDGRGHVSPLDTPSRLTSFLPCKGQARHQRIVEIKLAINLLVAHLHLHIYILPHVQHICKRLWQ